MGSTYANLTVLDAKLDDVRTALVGTGALLAAAGTDVVVFSAEHEDRMGDIAIAERLAFTVATSVVDVMVFDSDVVVVHVIGPLGLVAAATAPPGGAEMMEEMAGAGDVVPGSGSTPGATATALVAAVARGDATAVEAALVADEVFADDAHHRIFEALSLPTIGVGWGYRYVEHDPTRLDGVVLIRA